MEESEKHVSKYDVAACFIGIKTARFGSLQGVEPLNESQLDSLLDWVNYIVLMAREKVKYEGKNKETETPSAPAVPES